MKELIAYYSRAGENYFNGSIKSIEKGNTEIIAEKLGELTGAPLFRIRQKTPYSDNYRECVRQAREDMKNNARPELAGIPKERAEVLYLGFPNYCGTMPMAVVTFLESICTEGITILPFCSNEGSGMGRSVEDIRRYCPGANVTEGLSVHGRTIDETALRTWAQKKI